MVVHTCVAPPTVRDTPGTSLSASTLQHHHVIILVFIGGGVIVLQVEEGDGAQLGRDAAGTGAAVWVDGIHEGLHYGMFGGTQVGGQRVEAFPGALACLGRGRES